MRILALIAAPLLFQLTACSGPASPPDTGMGNDETLPAPSTDVARAALQDWFDSNAQCTLFFAAPHDVPVDFDHGRKQAQAFVDAGLFHEQGEMSLADPGNGSGQRRVIRYALTAKGEKQVRLRAGASDGAKTTICYGHREVNAVEVGEPDPRDGRVEVTYRYRLGKVPAWARSPSVLTFYPTFREWLDREEEDNAILTLRDGKWISEGPLSPALFDFLQLGR